MLDFIYYPVSFILWCWHKVFGFVLGPDNGFAWALAIVFLVFTLRALLLKPAIHQVRSMRKMQEFQPQIKAIQKKYANDRQRQAQEMQKLQREHGFNPVGGCLPIVFQIPVFIGLNHVLRNFRPEFGSNYFFPHSDIISYLNADILGAHLDDAIVGLGFIGQRGVESGWHWEVAPVAIPLMIVAAIATHFTARLSVARQRAMGTSTGGAGQQELMMKLQLYIFPLGVLTFGAGLLIGLLLYWVSNNAWTLGQQHFVFRRMDREEAKKKEEAQEARQALAPKPGQKPGQARGAKQDDGSAAVDPDGTGDAARSGAGSARTGTGKSGSGAGKGGASGGKDNTGASKNGAGTGKNGAGAGKETVSTSNGDGSALSPTGSVPGLISDRSRKKKRNRK